MKRPAVRLAPLLLSLALAGCRAGEPASVVLASPEPFDAPRAVAAAGEHVYVLDETGQFYGLDRRGRLVAKTRLIKTTRGFPVGLTPLADGSLLVADTHESRVLRLSPDGQKDGTLVGEYGSGPGQFVYPQRIAVTADEIFVTEYGYAVNNRVQVFRRDGTFVRSFGDYGTSGGAFSRACGIVVGPGDRVYVADASHRILVWTREGKYLRDIGAKGREPGRLYYPYGLASDDEFLYVVEYGNHRISRFRRDGAFAGVWGGLGQRPDQLTKPRDLACSDGYLYVADTGNDRIVRVRLEGLTWRYGS
ncbi:MAG: NHL repeat-containing protein [Planctomycetota bacterium]